MAARATGRGPARPACGPRCRPHYLQRKLVFQDSGFFFSDTKRGRRWCIISSSCFMLLVIGSILYEVAWLMGYVNAPPFSWFSC